MIRTDKLLHAETSALLVVVISELLSLLMKDSLALVLASFATLVIGFGKELYDWASHKGVADRKDFRADVVGTAIGIIITLLQYL